MVRNGLRGRRQLHKCRDCGRQFIGGQRRDKSQVITDYVEGKQTLDQLALKYGVNERTIRRDLEGMRYVQKISKDKHVTIQIYPSKPPCVGAASESCAMWGLAPISHIPYPISQTPNPFPGRGLVASLRLYYYLMRY